MKDSVLTLPSIGSYGILGFMLVFLVAGNLLHAQCTINAYSDKDSICNGETVDIWSVIDTNETLLHSDFNDSTLGVGWSATSSATFDNPCTGSTADCPPAPDSTYFWMGKDAAHPRELETKDFCVANGGKICFYMRFAEQASGGCNNDCSVDVWTGNCTGDAPCEGIDLANEGVYLRYSTDGGSTWNLIEYFGPNGVGDSTSSAGSDPQMTSWTRYCYNIPPGAQTPNTRFKWGQYNSSGCCNDHWGVDSVVISLPEADTLWWNHGPTVIDPPDVSPSTTTDYIVNYVTDDPCVPSGKDTCRDTVTIPVHANPTAQFAGDTMCGIDSVQFTENSSPGTGETLQQWKWSFGDGSTSSDTAPIHSYPDDGNYSVQLEVTNSAGCKDTAVKTVNLKPAPSVGFRYFRSCLGEPTPFDDTSSAGDITASITDWHWEFGDGDIDSVTDPTHEYDSSGSYEVKLVVTNSESCQDSMIDTVNVRPRPQADFGYSGRCLSDSVLFTDSSYAGSPAASISMWRWYFGDGWQKTGAPVKYQYDSSGTYTVQLVIENDANCPDTATQSVTIVEAPIADFTANSPCVGDTVYFSNTSDTGSVALNQRLWKFGDGNSSTAQNPSHYYGATNLYQPQLILTNDSSCSDTATKPVSVRPKPTANFSTTTPCGGDTTTLQDLSAGGGRNASVVTYDWSLGDGATDTTAIVNHQYDSFGTYTVTLVVTNDSMCSDTITQPTQVRPGPQADFSYTSTCQGDSMQFTDSSRSAGSNLTNWDWRFGDGGTASQPNPSHYYSSQGLYAVQLAVSNDSSCADTVQKTVSVRPAPVVSFQAENVCQGDSVEFTNNSIAGGGGVNVQQWTWQLGDGTVVNQYEPTYAYGAVGNYNARLIAVNDSNCIDTSQRQVTVYQNPPLQLTSNKKQGCAPLQVRFTNDTGANMQLNYEWSFGDGSSSNQEGSVMHTFDSSGFYDIRLSVIDSNNCQSSTVRQQMIEVFESPRADFTTEPPGTDMTIVESVIQFLDQSTDAEQWHWDFGTGDTSTLTNPEYAFNDTGRHQVVLTVRGSNDCPDTALMNIRVRSEVTMHIPNAFSPNGDGINEQFQPVGFFQGMQTYQLKIWNRWGELIFETKDKQQAWNGKRHNNGSLVPAGTYIVQITYTDVNGKGHSYSGYVFVER